MGGHCSALDLNTLVPDVCVWGGQGCPLGWKEVEPRHQWLEEIVQAKGRPSQPWKQGNTLWESLIHGGMWWVWKLICILKHLILSDFIYNIYTHVYTINNVHSIYLSIFYLLSPICLRMYTHRQLFSRCCRVLGKVVHWARAIAGAQLNPGCSRTTWHGFRISSQKIFGSLGAGTEKMDGWLLSPGL